MCAIMENLLIGVFSGFISSVIVTQIYRQIDKKQNRLEYLSEVLCFANDFEKALFHAYTGEVEIEDEYVLKLNDFIVDNNMPIKKKWVKLKRDENKICNEFITFYNGITQEIMKCYLDMRRTPEERKKYEDEIEMAKGKFLTVAHMEATLHNHNLIKAKREYTN